VRSDRKFLRRGEGKVFRLLESNLRILVIFVYYLVIFVYYL